jgi:hypothetical protein
VYLGDDEDPHAQLYESYDSFLAILDLIPDFLRTDFTVSALLDSLLIAALEGWSSGFPKWHACRRSRKSLVIKLSFGWNPLGVCADEGHDDTISL